MPKRYNWSGLYIAAFACSLALHGNLDVFNSSTNTGNKQLELKTDNSIAHKKNSKHKEKKEPIGLLLAGPFFFQP